LADKIGGNDMSLNALKRKLENLTSYAFFRPHSDKSTINEIVNTLDQGLHVVLEFGHYRSARVYMLVSNIITRKLHELYVEKTERYLSSKDPTQKPKQLVITIEEAHKFLSPAVARYTSFGEIAREMRKYNVTLLVVDQRPSSIADEIMSQLGTRITALLNDEKDIDAVFTGVSGSSALRQVLATLDSKQQALLLGHALPMPIVVRTRSYDEDFYRSLQTNSKGKGSELEQIFGKK